MGGVTGFTRPPSWALAEYGNPGSSGGGASSGSGQNNGMTSFMPSGFGAFGGQRVAPRAPQNSAGLGMMTQAAQAGNPLYGPSQSVTQDTLRMGGLNPYAIEASRTFGDLAGASQGSVQRQSAYGSIASNPLSGLQTEAVGGYRSARRMAAGPSYSEQHLMPMATGQFAREGNPYADETLERAMQIARANIASDASMSGRLGSGYHAGRLADDLGGIAAEFARQQYESDMNRMLTANQMIDAQRQGQIANLMGIDDRLGNMGQQSIMNRMGAIEAQGAEERADASRRMVAAQSLADTGFTANQMALGAAGTIPMFDRARFLDGQMLYDIGEMDRSYQQQVLDANLSQWNEGQQALINRMNSELTGARIDDLRESTEQRRPNPFLQGLGVAGGVAQLGNNLGLFGGSGGGGVLAGAGRGIAGLFGF